MFKSLLDKNYDVELRSDAMVNIIKERSHYEEIIMTILSFTEKHNLLVSNIDLLLDKQNYYNTIEIYVIKVDEIARELTTKLCKEHNQLFLMRIFEKDREYYIEYNLRKMCILHDIKPYKSFTLYDFVSPVKYIINKEITIYLLPYLIEIIHFYKTLYNPADAAKWEETYQNTKKLEIIVDDEIEDLLKMPKQELAIKLITTSTADAIGGEKNSKNLNNLSNSKDSKNLDNSKDSKNSDGKIQEIRKLVFDFIKDNKCILCTDYDGGIIEIISSNIEADYNALVHHLSRFIEYGISYKKKNVYLPKEHQMMRYNFYLEIPYIKRMKRKHFLTIYNNMSYELINFHEKNGFRYADPITQLRFTYLSIWSSIVMQKTYGLHYNEFITHIMEMKKQIKKLRGEVDIYELKKNYTGTYLPLTLSKKMLANFNSEKKIFYCHDF